MLPQGFTSLWSMQIVSGHNKDSIYIFILENFIRIRRAVIEFIFISDISAACSTICGDSHKITHAV